jgi:hypothetical protein
MARNISEKELEKIISEAATLAVERLSFISESKGKQAISEKKINEAVGESLKMVLKEDYSENHVENAINELANQCTEMVLKVKWGDDINNQNAEIDRKTLLKSFYNTIHSIM